MHRNSIKLPGLRKTGKQIESTYLGPLVWFGICIPFGLHFPNIIQHFYCESQLNNLKKKRKLYGKLPDRATDERAHATNSLSVERKMAEFSSPGDWRSKKTTDTRIASVYQLIQLFSARWSLRSRMIDSSAHCSSSDFRSRVLKKKKNTDSFV